MEIQELRPRLWRWTARHPGWEADAEPGSPADWPPEVGCIAYLARETLVLVDPLVPDGEWERIDELVGGRRAAVLTTVRWHERSAADAVVRYEAGLVPPAGVDAIALPSRDETIFWIPEHGALVPGDRLIGAPGGVRMCPESWLRYIDGQVTLADLRRELEPLLELPIEVVLVSHGEPVLTGGRDALARALET
jgi:hypothetical protein